MIVVKLPCGQFSIGSDAAFYFDDPRGAEIGPSKFLFASPDYFYRLPRGARQPRGFDCGIPRLLSAVCRACVRNDHADAALRNVKNARQFVAICKRPLCSGPDGEFVTSPLGNGSARLQWRMRDVRNVVGGIET